MVRFSEGIEPEKKKRSGVPFAPHAIENFCLLLESSCDLGASAQARQTFSLFLCGSLKVMGRTEPTIVRRPAAFRRDARSKRAKATVNKLIPSLLTAHPRARRGIEASELIVSPPASQSRRFEGTSAQSGPSGDSVGPRLTVQVADTLTAARSLLTGSGNQVRRVAILNMASPLSPGGGFLNGATSQEESLCMRTTLLPALKDEFYRLPEIGCVYTPDVLVFRSCSEQESDLLDKRDRWFVDVVSAAMLRLPETEIDDETGHSRYVHAKDRDLVLEKMKAVMHAFQAKGAAKVVLGAWGCGAYGNPIGEVARAWRRVLLNDSRKGKALARAQRMWDGIEEVVFAVKDLSMAKALSEAFGDGLELADDEDEGDAEDSTQAGGHELEAKTGELCGRIEELRDRIDRTSDPRLKEGLQAVKAGLESQMSGESVSC